MAGPFAAVRQRWGWPVVVFLLSAAVLTGGAVLAYRSESAAIEAQALDAARTVAAARAEIIAHSLVEQRARATILGRAPTLVEFLRQLPAGVSEAERERIAGFLEEVRATADLDNAWLIDSLGRRVVSAQEHPEDEAVWTAAALAAMASGKVSFVDFHVDVSDGTIDIGYVAPVAPTGDAGARALGAVALDLTAATFLEADLAAGPVMGKTGQAVLVRRDGDRLIYVGQLAPDGTTALQLETVPAEGYPIASRAAAGESGPIVGVDYRGVPVYAAAARVPETPWFVLIKRDQAEALAPVVRFGLVAGIVVLALSVSAGALATVLSQRGRLRAALADAAHARALHAAETRFRAIFEQAAVGIAITTPDGRWLRLNPRLLQMLGRDEDAMRGQSVLDVTHPDDRDASKRQIEQLRSGSAETIALEKRYIRDDGSIVWGSISVRPVRKTDQTPGYNIVAVQDITDRKRAEERLRKSEERFREVVESASHAMMLSGTDGRIEMVNKQAEEVFGFSRAELCGQVVETLVPARFRMSHGALHRAFLAAPRRRLMGMPRSLVGLRKDGSEVPIEVALAPIATEEGLKVLATIVDISARRQQEEMLAKTEEQLRHAQKMEAIGNLTGGMAHDFNNLLAVIIGNLDFVRPLVAADSEAAELIGEAADAAHRGAELTRRLLAFARRQPLRPQRVELNELIAGMAKLLRRTLGEDIRISLELADGLWPVHVDPAQVESALANLANNARDAMPSGGELHIATANRRLDDDYCALHPEVKPGDYALIEVSDTGTGMPPDVVAKIFEPFFTTKAPGKGTGLGLSMIFGFVKQSGGHISVYSEPAAGTTFRLYLPRSAEAVGEASTVAPVDIPRAAGETILAVEDSEALRRLVVRQLADLGYRVIAAKNAEEAVALLDQHPVDLVFTDVVMPGEMDGFGLARHALASRPNLRVVLTSGFPDTKLNGQLGAAARFGRILSKPYRKEELARVLRDALSA